MTQNDRPKIQMFGQHKPARKATLHSTPLPRLHLRELRYASAPLDYLAARLWKYPTSLQLYRASSLIWRMLTPAQTRVLLDAAQDRKSAHYHLFQYWFANFKRHVWRLTDENFGVLLWLCVTERELRRDPGISVQLCDPKAAGVFATMLARERKELTATLVDKLYDLYLVSLNPELKWFQRRKVLAVNEALKQT